MKILLPISSQTPVKPKKLDQKRQGALLNQRRVETPTTPSAFAATAMVKLQTKKLPISSTLAFTIKWELAEGLFSVNWVSRPSMSWPI
jgi:hypothetical protein